MMYALFVDFYSSIIILAFTTVPKN